MKLLSPELIPANQAELQQIDETVRSIYRKIVFNKDYQKLDLLSRYLEATEHLRDVLSIKNAQQEAQSIEEAREYLDHLKEAMTLIVDEIAGDKTLSSPVDLFHIMRVIAPEAASKNSNHYRQTIVQFGPCTGALPEEIEPLIEELFYAITQINHPVLRAIYLHHELVRIHPFVDGNGRLSRMSKNWILMYELYPPIFIQSPGDKKEYIQNLQGSFLDIEGNPEELHPSTQDFFKNELRRIKASSNFILSRMLKNPTETFEDMQQRNRS